ncbi:MAG: hypothetical protein V7606_1600 [Burkholderiales bacterium]|jgi:hypothetical protein
MSNEPDSDRYDPTTPEELFALAKHLAADPKLEAIFQRVGLHKPFIRPDEYHLVLASSKGFAPHLEDRLCSSSNLPVAEALARRLHAGKISSDADALAFLADRIRHYPDEFKGRSALLESEVKDIMRNLLNSSFFQEFEDYRRQKAEIIKTDIDPYEHVVGFVGEQIWIYGLGGRGWNRVELIVTSFLNRLWFDVVPDLSSATVERMLQSPREFLILCGDDDLPRKG